MVPFWVFRNETRFWNWVSSFETGCSVLKLLEWQNYTKPSSSTGSSSSSGCPILARCQLGNVGVPVPELDDQFQNWNSAKMGSNIYVWTCLFKYKHVLNMGTNRYYFNQETHLLWQILSPGLSFTCLLCPHTLNVEKDTIKDIQDYPGHWVFICFQIKMQGIRVWTRRTQRTQERFNAF